MGAVKLNYSVGKNGKNKAIDVALVQRLLREHYTSEHTRNKSDSSNYRYLYINGNITDTLIDAIKNFQSSNLNMKKPDGKIDPAGKTFTALINTQTKKPSSTRNFILGNESGVHTIKLSPIPTAHMKKYFKQYLGLTTSKGEDFSGLFDMLKKDSEISDVRWAAYMMATAYHETTYSFKPVRESGKGKGYKYSKEYEVTDKAGIRGKKNQKYKNVYYGRGYVQLTWDYNYKIVGKAIGQADNLHINPDLALKKDIAYKVMSYGMRKGSFTKRKLSDYLSSGKTDYIGARYIINGTDKNSIIAGYAETIELLLRLASKPTGAKSK